jgi:hypothetical protein
VARLKREATDGAYGPILKSIVCAPAINDVADGCELIHNMPGIF